MQLSPCTYTPSNLQRGTDCPTRRQLTAHITQLILLINYAQSISSQRITQYTIPGDHVSSTESNSSYLSDLHVNSPAKSCTEVCQSVNVSVFPFCPLRYEDKLVVAVPPESMELARCPNTMVFYRGCSAFLLKQGEQSVDVAGIAGNSLHFYLLSIRGDHWGS